MKKHLFLLLALLACCTLAAATPNEDLEKVCLEAEAAAQAGDLDAAIQKWEAATAMGLDGGRLHYNLGNLHARQRHYGHAIAHYLKAQRRMPGNLDLANNLRYVRSQRQDNFEAPESTRVLRTLFFWHYDLSPALRLRLALWPVPLLALAAAFLLWRRPLWLAWSAALLALWCAAFALSAGLSHWNESRHGVAIVVAAETTPRKGDDATYAAAFNAPLHDGAEVTVTRRRAGWTEVRLPNGLTGWLPDADLAFI